MKTRDQIRAETPRSQIPRPAGYEYGKKLQEWDASLLPGEEDVLKRIKSLLNDRMLVRLVEKKQPGAIVVVGEPELIGGMREAVVLKCGPGKWEPGDWWKIDPAKELQPGDIVEVNSAGWWQWFPPERRPIAVHPGQTVYIGNWVDLEANGLALCQEGDIRGYVNERAQAAQNGAHRQAQISEGRHKRGAGRSTRISHAAKAL